MVEMDKSDPVKDNELYQAFRLFDADGDGFVSLEEFTRAMEVCLIFAQLNCAVFSLDKTLGLFL